MSEITKEWPVNCARSFAAAMLHQAVDDLKSTCHSMAAMAWLKSEDASLYLDVLDINPEVFSEAIDKKHSTAKVNQSFQMMLNL